MATAGPNTGATATDAAGIGTVAWTNPTNAQVSDNVYATCVLSAQASHWLKVTNFGFSIPANATINGITQEWEVKTNVISGFVSLADAVKGGTIVNVATGWLSFQSDTSESFDVAGGVTELWGTTWTPTDINSSTFGAAYASNGSRTDTFSVDSCRITVTYSTGIGVLTQGKLVRGTLVNRGIVR